MQTSPTTRRILGWALALAAAASPAACAHQTSTYTPPAATVAGAPAMAPRLIVERFLQATNADDITTMGQLFGTKDGPIIDRDPRPEVEKRMYALASLLKHQDYRIEGQEIVPGRLNEAIKILVRLKMGEDSPILPFTVVRSGNGWLVEQIDLDALATRR